MAILFVYQTGDGQLIKPPHGFNAILKKENKQGNNELLEYEIESSEIPGWLRKQLETSPDVFKYWLK